MLSTLVYTTDTASVAAHRQVVTAIANVHSAAQQTHGRTVHGMCLSCGAVEVRLSNVVGHHDLSGIGESSRYPIGHGCEACD